MTREAAAIRVTKALCRLVVRSVGGDVAAWDAKVRELDAMSEQERVCETDRMKRELAGKWLVEDVERYGRVRKGNRP